MWSGVVVSLWILRGCGVGVRMHWGVGGVGRHRLVGCGLGTGLWESLCCGAVCGWWLGWEDVFEAVGIIWVARVGWQ